MTVCQNAFTKKMNKKMGENLADSFPLLLCIRTHEGTRLVLLPSRSDTIHKTLIVLAFRQRLL